MIPPPNDEFHHLSLPLAQKSMVRESVNDLVRLWERAPSGRIIVGIVGAPGAGKSTMASALIARMDDLAIPSALIPMDGFHLPHSELVRRGTADHKGAPDTFDAAGYVDLLRRLRTRTPYPVFAPTFDRNTEEPIPGAIRVSPAVQIVLTEGNYLLLETTPWNQIREVLDETWFIRVPEALRRDRLIIRHQMFGKTKSQAMKWVSSVDEPNALRVDSTAFHADRTIDWESIEDELS